MPLPVDIKSALSSCVVLLLKHQTNFVENEELLTLITTLNRTLQKDRNLPIFKIPAWITHFTFIKDAIKKFHISALDIAIQQMLDVLKAKSQTIGFAGSRRREKDKVKTSDTKSAAQQRQNHPLPQLFNVAFSPSLVETKHNADIDFSAKLKKFKGLLDKYLALPGVDNPALKKFSIELDSVYLPYFLTSKNTEQKVTVNPAAKLQNEFYSNNKIKDIILGIDNGKCYRREYLDLRYEMLNVILPALHKMIPARTTTKKHISELLSVASEPRLPPSPLGLRRTSPGLTPATKIFLGYSPSSPSETPADTFLDEYVVSDSGETDEVFGVDAGHHRFKQDP